MKRPPKLTAQQAEIVRELEPQLRACVPSADIAKAKRLAARLQRVLCPTGHRTRWMMNQNWLCDCAIEAGETAFAVQRLEGIRATVAKTTRVYLEATTLLAICYIRSGGHEKAKPLIAFVLGNRNKIGSDKRRRQFYERFIVRVEEECILAALRESVVVDLDVDRVQKEAVRMLPTDENSLLLQLGSYLPPGKMKLLAEMRSHAIASLPPVERKLLSTSDGPTAPSGVAKRVRASLQRVTWRAVCDPKDEIYQKWSEGLSVVYDKKWITAAIIASCRSWKITASMIVTTFVALALKLGAKVFCDAFAPSGVMISLSEKD